MELNIFDKICQKLKTKNMNTKALFPCLEGSNLILKTGRDNQIFYIGVFYVKTVCICMER